MSVSTRVGRVAPRPNRPVVVATVVLVLGLFSPPRLSAQSLKFRFPHDQFLDFRHL